MVEMSLQSSRRCLQHFAYISESIVLFSTPTRTGYQLKEGAGSWELGTKEGVEECLEGFGMVGLD